MENNRHRVGELRRLCPLPQLDLGTQRSERVALRALHETMTGAVFEVGSGREGVFRGQFRAAILAWQYP
jgi:hypothetical protein